MKSRNKIFSPNDYHKEKKKNNKHRNGKNYIFRPARGQTRGSTLTKLEFIDKQCKKGCKYCPILDGNNNCTLFNIGVDEAYDILMENLKEKENL